MKHQKSIFIVAIIFIAIIGIIGIYTTHPGSNSGSNNQITDMLGRNIAMPTGVDRVYALSSSTEVILYMLTPDKMVGWDAQRSLEENQYMPQKYQNLPIFGGGKKDANYESIISSSPDIILIGHGGTVADVNEIQQKFGTIPTIDIEGDNNLTNIVPSINFMGKVLNEKNKADELVNFYSKVLQQVNNTVATIPENEKKKVYYTNDPNGLKTYAPGDQHVDLIKLCGGVNVVEAPVTKGGMGVSMELILQWNPDVIITSDSQFYKNVYLNPQWQNINAVKNKEVYLVPQSPFNWFEGPPGANTIIGIPWTAKAIYPDKFKYMDLTGFVKEFYSSFYHYNLTDVQIKSILNSSGIKQL
jgi:iron complex transport system substrate-binding protein